MAEEVTNSNWLGVQQDATYLRDAATTSAEKQAWQDAASAAGAVVFVTEKRDKLRIELEALEEQARTLADKASVAWASARELTK